MRALRYRGALDLRLEHVPELEPEPGWVKLAVSWCGICGTDLHEYQSGPHLIPPPVRPHVLTGETLPLTMGHEFAGEVVAVGYGVLSIGVGEAVAVDPSIACHSCDACRAGLLNRCPRRGAVGLHGWGGGFAEYVTLPEYMLHRLPPGVSAQAGALVEPIAVGWHGVELAQAGPGSTVLIIGCGPIGFGALVAAKALGVKRVLVAARREGVRSRMATDFGADAVWLSSLQSVPEAIADETAGRGVDVVLETSGTQRGLEDGLNCTAIGGSLVTLGMWDHAALIDLNHVLLGELRVLGSRGYGDAYPRMICAMGDGRIAGIERMVTKRVALDAAVADGFDELIANKSEHMKILVAP